jgi:steroid delta-isomerase-like uncharacterized protein
VSPSELIETYYQAFNRCDLTAMVALVTEDFVHDPNQGHRRVGRDMFLAFLQTMGRNYQEQVIDLVVMVVSTGDRAAAEFLIEGRYLAAEEGLPPARGQRYRLPVGAFFELRDGKIARVTNYYNLTDWLAQVSA